MDVVNRVYMKRLRPHRVTGVNGLYMERLRAHWATGVNGLYIKSLWRDYTVWSKWAEGAKVADGLGVGNSSAFIMVK